MKTVCLVLSDNIDIKEFAKTICFISEDIVEYHFCNNELIMIINENADSESIKEEVKKYSHRYISPVGKESKCIKVFKDEPHTYFYEELMNDNNGLINDFGNGLIGLNGVAIKLYRFFDNIFRSIALQVDAIEKMYPVLLPIEVYRRTGYLRNSPQYSMFCCCPKENIYVLEEIDRRIKDNNVQEILNEPTLALSPSACFHTYYEYNNKKLNSKKVFTFVQNVFRNEGRMNFGELGRLRDYHVREIVFFGDHEYILEKRKQVMEKSSELMKKLGLAGKICTAADPFIIPKMQKYKKIQLLDASKYELRVNYCENKDISVASFNIHGSAFTQPFNIKIEDVLFPETGCIGFGIERWVFVFLSQYGIDIENWPSIIKKQVERETYYDTLLKNVVEE